MFIQNHFSISHTHIFYAIYINGRMFLAPVQHIVRELYTYDYVVDNCFWNDQIYINLVNFFGFLGCMQLNERIKVFFWGTDRERLLITTNHLKIHYEWKRFGPLQFLTSLVFLFVINNIITLI